MKITLGGERLGSGKKMDTELQNYSRSTHNLSQSWKSTMAPGVLVPFLKLLAMNGDTFDIELNAGLRTIPTKAPIYGSFKLQLDMFECPIRLYQGLLHNNPINLGMNMAQVKLPTMPLLAYDQVFDNDPDNSQVCSNSLYKYLGISGAGTNAESDELFVERRFNAVPLLAYYDIFKNYYANKQEEMAYVITPNVQNETLVPNTKILYCAFMGTDETIPPYIPDYGKVYTFPTPADKIIIDKDANYSTWNFAKIELKLEGNITLEQIKNIPINYDNTTETLESFCNTNSITIEAHAMTNEENTMVILEAKEGFWDEATWASVFSEGNVTITPNFYTTRLPIKISSFPLEYIDGMREAILQNTSLGTSFDVETFNDLPYKCVGAMYDQTPNPNIVINKMAYPMNGLVLKTYQSDIFNNWLQKEWIDGDNGIAAVTAVDVSDGSLNLDALNLAQKIYNMLNRIAAAGGTYQDWQRAVYTSNVIMHTETPIWCGGMSSEIVFDEVVSTAETQGEDLTNALGGLAGKGVLKGKKGGKLHIKVNEPSYIIGIVSITPRVDYMQGNDFDMTDIFSVDDIHKPELDGIGFQDLLVERMAWWNTRISDNGEIERDSAGKIPAWIEYMTAVNKTYGDFARKEGHSYMVLNRNYEHVEDSFYQVKDVTTYIDPAKYNYAFAYDELDAQNFWVQIVSDIKARRKMSAKIIPNL